VFYYADIGGLKHKSTRIYGNNTDLIYMVKDNLVFIFMFIRNYKQMGPKKEFEFKLKSFCVKLTTKMDFT